MNEEKSGEPVAPGNAANTFKHSCQDKVNPNNLNYIVLINNFWEVHANYQFKPQEIALYLYLLDVCNVLFWQNPFEISYRQMERGIGIGKQRVKKYLKRLQAAKLIKVIEGKAARENEPPELTKIKILERIQPTDQEGAERIQRDTLTAGRERIQRDTLTGRERIQRDTINKQYSKQIKTGRERRKIAPPAHDKILDVFTRENQKQNSQANPAAAAAEFVRHYAAKNWIFNRKKIGADNLVLAVRAWLKPPPEFERRPAPPPPTRDQVETTMRALIDARALPYDPAAMAAKYFAHYEFNQWKAGATMITAGNLVKSCEKWLTREPEFERRPAQKNNGTPPPPATAEELQAEHERYMKNKSHE